MFRAFDPVVIRLSLDATNVQREKIVFELVKPFISGFSVEPMEIDAEEQQSSTAKRKATESATIPEIIATPPTGEPIAVDSTSKITVKKNKKSKK